MQRSFRTRRLLLSLLNIEPDERPSNTVAVIDELTALVGLTPESEEAVIHGYLDSNALIGRERERNLFSATLARAMQGTPQVICLEGRAGIGRTRLIEELAITARMSGSTVVEATPSAEPYATAAALARALFTALPAHAVEAARAYADAIAALAPDLTSKLGLSTAAHNRQSIVDSVARWIFAVAEQRGLVVVVDDLHAVDEESMPLIAALCRAEPGRRLLVLTSICSDAPLAEHSGVRTIQASAARLVLPKLGREQVGEMLQSLFGNAPFIERLALRLHEVSQGVPGQVQRLVRHLVETGVVRYVDGAWVLPMELPKHLPSSLDPSALAALSALPAEVRRLAALASVPDYAPLSRSMLFSLSRDSTDDAIARLLHEEVLVESPSGLRPASPLLAEALWSALSVGERARVHRALARALPDSDDPRIAMRKALHLLRAGEFAAGEALVLRATRSTLSDTTEVLTAVAPMFAEACDLMRAAQRPAHAKLPALSALALAGYTVDRTFEARYGDEALDVLQKTLRFDLAFRLQPMVGGVAALVIALGAASVTLRLKRTRLNALEIVSWLVPGVVALVGTSSTCIDTRKGRRYLRALEPLVALGRDHAAALMHSFATSLLLGNEDRVAAAQAISLSIVERMRDPAPIRGMPDAARAKLFAGGCFAFAGTTYKLGLLWHRDGTPLAALVLASAEGIPQLPRASVLRLMGESLANSQIEPALRDVAR